MGILVSIIGLFAIVIGLVGLVSPHRLTRFATSIENTTRFRLAVGVRLLVGIAFFLMAPFCSFPIVVEIVAVVTIIAAFVILISGQKRLDSLIDWWAGCSPNIIRVSAGFAILIGIVIACSGV